MVGDKTLPAPVWVDNSRTFQVMVDDLANQPQVAADTESNSLHAYREQVCLIQFSTTRTDYLVDPLELTDLSLLAPILANPGIEKVFHAAEYDLICLRRDFGFVVSNLFDTMHASKILGYPAVGLDKLLSYKFGVQMDKRHQKANWATRPLTREQTHYARLDTHYLLELRGRLEQELRAKGRWVLAQEDFRRACEVDVPKARSGEDAIRRFIGRKDLSDRELTILNELCTWRESAAESLNRPLYKVLADDVLIGIARAAPIHKVDLAGIGMTERQIGLWGDEVLTAVARGLSGPPIERRNIRPRNEAMLARLEKLKRWRKQVAEQSALESDIVLPRPYLIALAETPPKNRPELAGIMRESPSRVQEYGEQILQLLGD